MDPFYHAAQQQLPLFASITKICTKCDTEKPLEQFALSKRGLHGRRADCTKCRVKANRERLLHPERKIVRKPVEKPQPKVKPIPQPGYKFCGACNAEKSLEEFHAHPRGAFGRDSKCKECRSVYNATRRIRPGYKEYDRDKHRKNKAYYAAHYLENKETYRERDRAWRKANPEKARASHIRRKAHKLKAKVEDVDYKAIVEQYGYHCYLCDKPIDPTVKSRTTAGLTFDHIIPLIPRPGEPQGSHTADNIRPAHHACNVRKGNTPLDQLTPWHRRGV